MFPPTSDLRRPTTDLRPSASDCRRFLLRRAAIAPLCLCLVAGLHAVRVVAYGQTQWKGGGFGMFSTVDSEAARFVRAFAITDEGELPLAIPAHLDKTIAELRAAPTAAKAEAVARRLASIRWQRPDERMVREAQRWTGGASMSPFAPRKDVLSRSESRLPQPPVGLFRSLEAIPTDEPAEHALSIGRVRVECYRLRMDSQDSTLHSELVRAFTAEAAP